MKNTGLIVEFTGALAERTITQSNLLYAVEDGVDFNGQVYKVEKVLEGNGVFNIKEGYFAGEFQGGSGSYQLKLKVPKPLKLANGITVRYRILDWASLRYLAIGHTAEGGFRHVKIANPSEGEWVTFTIGFQDLAFGLQNNWQKPDSEEISDIRLYISGVPLESGGKIEVMWASTWLEKDQQQLNKISNKTNEKLSDSIKNYFIRCNPHISEQVEGFLHTGDCPLTGQVKLSWPIDKLTPNDIEKSGTYRYLWHAMQPAISMMVYAKISDTTAPIYAARDYINTWLDHSFFRPDPDVKYTWYDHGTAERLLAFLFMYNIGIDEGFDIRYLRRLYYAIYMHAQLLESEAFYASHQPTRYHNHAWFQDMALIAVAIAMPDISSSARWLKRGIERLTDQFSKLIVRDGGYAIFVENSIGYHHGVQRLVEFAGELVALSGLDSFIPEIAEELEAWSKFLRYPDGRTPSQGDTFRLPNSSNKHINRGEPYRSPGCTLLPVAGYAVIKGNHNEIPFMICMFATSLCKTHKHEDNLSFTLFFDGIEWLIDPSFYSHEYDCDVPLYLRSAWGHNNVAISNARYSIEPGNAKLFGHYCGSQYEVSGSHTAYEGFVVHRNLCGSTRALDLALTDHVFTETSQKIDVFSLFHLGEGVEACFLDEGIQLSHPGSTHRLLICGPDMSAELIEGWNEGESVHGVVGLGFMQKTSSVSISFSMRVNQKHVLKIMCI